MICYLCKRAAPYGICGPCWILRDTIICKVTWARAMRSDETKGELVHG